MQCFLMKRNVFTNSKKVTSKTNLLFEQSCVAIEGVMLMSFLL